MAIKDVKADKVISHDCNVVLVFRLDKCTAIGRGKV